MGYTHYWSFKTARPESKRIEEAYQKAIKKCQELIFRHNKELKAIDNKHPDRLSGFCAHVRPGTYGGLKVDGTQELSHEDFCLREHYSENESDFCKTARKPYDSTVIACLIILKHYLGEHFQVGSDGYASERVDGLELAKKHTGLKSLVIPGSISRENLKVVS